MADPDLDPDPHESAFILVGWIRIRNGNTDPDPGGPNVQATGEACGPQKRTSSTSKYEISYLFKAFLAFLRLISSHCYFPSILSLQGGCLISSHKGQDETNKKKIRHVWWQNKDKFFL